MIAPEGLRFLPAHFDLTAQRSLIETVMDGVALAPFFTPVMPRTGQPFSVRMTNFGPLGWISDRDGGYRYEARHPETGALWPAIPKRLMALWDEVCAYRAPPEACLVNLYRDGAKMGLHVDADELARDAPVLSISLGDAAVFRIGGPSRRDPTSTLVLNSGDVLVMGGKSRHCFHGIDRVRYGSSRLMPGGGRLNLTLRRVTRPD